MPFLHGFRRIVYEYQPLVDAIMCVVGMDEGAGKDRALTPEDEDEDVVCGSLLELLDREAQSEVFMEGISYALFKVAERGLVHVAEILLRYGADVNFEDPVSYYNPLHIAILRNQPNVLKLLVDHGADIEKRDRIHESCPLDLASELSERLLCLLTLLDMGADVNAKDKYGKTPLLHALESSDGLAVRNTETIQLLLERGADVNAANVLGETAESSLVILVKEALDGSAEDAALIGRFCLKTTKLLLAHGAELRCSLNEDNEPSLLQISLEFFDLLFPLAVLLIQSGASLDHSHHSLICQQLQTAVWRCPDQRQLPELLEQAEVLLDMARVDHPLLHLPPRLTPHLSGENPQPFVQSLIETLNRAVGCESSPPALRCLCRAFIRSRLQPRPLEERVKALPLPDRLKDFLLPESTYTPKPGWDCFKPKNGRR